MLLNFVFFASSTFCSDSLGNQTCLPVSRFSSWNKTCSVSILQQKREIFNSVSFILSLFYQLVGKKTDVNKVQLKVFSFRHAVSFHYGTFFWIGFSYILIMTWLQCQPRRSQWKIWSRRYPQWMWPVKSKASTPNLFWRFLLRLWYY